MDILQLEKGLNTERKPLYIIKGNDTYYKRSALHKFEELVCGVASDMNINYFPCNALIEDIINALNTPAFMSDIRLVVWYGDNKKINTDISKTYANTLKKYLDEPNLNAILLMVEEDEYFKFAYKMGELVECNKLESSQLMQIVSKKINALGYTANSAIIKEIISRSDNDMEIINNELEKVFAYACDTKLIDNEVLNQCVLNNVEQEIFALTNAIASGNVDDVYSQLNALLLRGEKPLNLLALITAHFRRMFFGKISKLSDDSLAKKISAHPYAVKKARESAVSFKPMRLKKILDELQNIEFDCKQGKLSQEDGLHKAVCIALSNIN